MPMPMQYMVPVNQGPMSQSSPMVNLSKQQQLNQHGPGPGGASCWCVFLGTHCTAVLTSLLLLPAVGPNMVPVGMPSSSFHSSQLPGGMNGMQGPGMWPCFVCLCFAGCSTGLGLGLGERVRLCFLCRCSRGDAGRHEVPVRPKAAALVTLPAALCKVQAERAGVPAESAVQVWQAAMAAHTTVRQPAVRVAQVHQLQGPTEAPSKVHGR